MLVRSCVLAAMLAATSAAIAGPVTVSAGDSAILVFDASALTPYTSVGIAYSLDSVGATYSLSFFTNDDGTGDLVGDAAGTAGGSGGFNLWNNTGVFDGDFSAVVSAFGAPVTFDITATIYASAGTAGTLVEPTVLSQVPEPSTLALLAAGLAAAALTLRRKA